MGEIIEAEVMDNQQMSGGGMIQSRTAYTTAMTVIRPRNLNVVVDRCMQEAAIAGDEFYYAWKQGGSMIEGLTIGAAMSIARNLGNCAIPVTVEETKDTYIFTATFIDLETGFNLQRGFRQNKKSPKNKSGKDIYEGERGADIVFQIGQSKAIRNVVTSSIPKWLQNKVMAKAKENVVGKIEQMGKPKATEFVLKKAAALAIPTEILEASFGKQAGWDTIKLVGISGALRGIEDGFLTVAEAFPSDAAKDDIAEKLTPKKADDGGEPKAEKKGIQEVKSPLMIVKGKARLKGIPQAELDKFCSESGVNEENAQSILDDEGGLGELIAKYKENSLEV